MRKTTTSTIICVLALLLLPLTACNNTDDSKEPLYTLNDLLDIAHERRLNIIANRPDYQRLSQFTADMDFVPTTGVVFPAVRVRRAGDLHITAEEAAGDAMLLFYVMRQLYGPYIYFGGDDVFVPIFDTIVDEIMAFGEMATLDLHLILVNNLDPVIRDNHFMLGTMSFSVNAIFHKSLVPFDRDERGFIHRASGLVVTEIEEHDMYYVLRLSMDEQGDVFYSPIVYDLHTPIGLIDQTRTIRVHMEDGSVIELGLERYMPQARVASMTRMWRVDGVPIMNIMQMGNPDAVLSTRRRDVETQTFLGFIDELRDEPVFIIDLRGNDRGYITLGEHWLYTLLGESVPRNSLRVAGYARYAMQTSPIRDNHLVQHDGLIIMLIDRSTSFAAEAFADHLFSMRNTLVIGQNSNGSHITSVHDQEIPWTLPNSGLQLRFGDAVFAHPEGHFAEGLGFAPDIWVHGDALTATLALIDNNRDD